MSHATNLCALAGTRTPLWNYSPVYLFLLVQETSVYHESPHEQANIWARLRSRSAQRTRQVLGTSNCGSLLFRPKKAARLSSVTISKLDGGNNQRLLPEQQWQ